MITLKEKKNSSVDAGSDGDLHHANLAVSYTCGGLSQEQTQRRNRPRKTTTITSSTSTTTTTVTTATTTTTNTAAEGLINERGMIDARPGGSLCLCLCSAACVS